MNTLSQDPVESAAVTSQSNPQQPPLRTRSVFKCNFRTAGKLSNENARALTTMHEEIAQLASGALDRYLGTAPEVKLGNIDQVAVKDHVASTSSLNYIAPFSSGLLTVEFDNDLVFPIIELLMGGKIEAKSTGRTLSEIEEEIMQDIVGLIVRQAETIWAIPEISLIPDPHAKSSMTFQSFRPTEKLTVLRFDMTIGNLAGGFNLVLSTALLDSLLKRIKTDQPQKNAKVWNFPMPPLSERVLDCEFEVTAELRGLRVAVKDLVTLQPGSVLKLRAPVQTPGTLTAGGRGLFEAVPVRSGSHRAAQLRHRTNSKDWKRR